MDDGDRAQIINDNLQADALAAHARRNTPPPCGHPPYKIGGDQGGVCIDCDEAINPRRVAAHPAAARCIDCQEEFERRSRR